MRRRHARRVKAVEERRKRTHRQRLADSRFYTQEATAFRGLPRRLNLAEAIASALADRKRDA